MFWPNLSENSESPAISMSSRVLFSLGFTSNPTMSLICTEKLIAFLTSANQIQGRAEDSVSGRERLS